MCADIAIHDKGDRNPHAHVMLTLRSHLGRSKMLLEYRNIQTDRGNENRDIETRNKEREEHEYQRRLSKKQEHDLYRFR